MSKYYFIKTNQNDLVLEITGKPVPGMLVQLGLKYDGRKQKWRVDDFTKTIRTCTSVGDYCMDIQNGKLVVNPYDAGNTNQQWGRSGDWIANPNNQKYLEAAGDTPGSNVVEKKQNETQEQKWSFFETAGDV